MHLRIQQMFDKDLVFSTPVNGGLRNLHIQFHLFDLATRHFCLHLSHLGPIFYKVTLQDIFFCAFLEGWEDRDLLFLSAFLNISSDGKNGVWNETTGMVWQPSRRTVTSKRKDKMLAQSTLSHYTYCYTSFGWLKASIKILNIPVSKSFKIDFWVSFPRRSLFPQYS